MQRKYSSIKHLAQAINRRQPGFALIATITLMLLLALLSVGLLSIAGTQTRLSEKGLYASDARAQARMALEIAIGRLQCELGPDQRVSANSGILDSSNSSSRNHNVNSPHILGVWDSWDTWLNRNRRSGGGSISSTYNKSRSTMFRTWLISSPDQLELQRLDSPNSELGSRRGASNAGSKVQLVGRGVLGDDRNEKNEIHASLVQVDDSQDINRKQVSKKNSQIRKGLAWWVTGENQKIRINLPAYQAGNSNRDIDILRKTWNTPPADNSTIDDLGSLSQSLPSKSSPDYDTRVRQLISRGVLNIITGSTGSRSLGRVYHDISLSSSGLLTDSKFGGLKKDINVLCSLEELPDEFKKNNADVGLRPYSNEDGTPTEGNRPISSWNQLFLWSNVWDSQSLKNGQDETASLVWSGKKPFSYIAADAEAQSGMMNNRYTYVRHPIMLKLYNFLGLLYRYHIQANWPKNCGHIDIDMIVTPVSVWWNPYNVDLHLKGTNGSMWGTYTGQHRIMPMIYSSNYNWVWYGDNTSPATKEENWANKTEKPFSPFCKDNYIGMWFSRQIADYGGSFRVTATLDDQGKGINGEISTMGPGEIIIYARPVSPNEDLYDPNLAVNMTLVDRSKKYGHDRCVDNFAYKEGWDENPNQITPYRVSIQSSCPYAALTGPEFTDNPDKYRALAEFAETSNDLNLTPDNFILAKRYTHEYKDNDKLGAFVLVAGLMDPDLIGQQQKIVNKQEGGNEKDPEVFFKAMPAIFNMNWGAWEKPLIDRIYFPQEMYDNSGAENKHKGGPGGRPTDLDATFVAYYGISVKWCKSPLIGTFPDGKDYRAKIWQHSSPLFWGSQMAKASELGRTYSPYQFEVKYSNDEFAPITIANVLSNDGTRLSVFGGPNGEQINKIVAAELPFHPPHSLAGYAGMRLTPGWYSSGTDDKPDIAKRFAYQSGVPGVGIGNSFADPMLPADRIFSSNEITGDSLLADFWDHGFMVNDALWDTWYASSLSKRPTDIGGSGTESLQDVVRKAVEIDPEAEEAPLANSRFSVRLNGNQASNVITEITAEDGYKKSAKYLRVDGAFNINSTSVVAWKALLSGLKDRKMLFMDNNGPAQLDQRGDMTYFSRFGVTSNRNSHVDDLGATGVSNGLQDGEAQSWSDLRKYDSAQIDKFAEQMVTEVKKRGPFLNMAEFVNRRLQSGEMGLKGALQTAIDESGMNSLFDSMSDKNIAPPVSYPHQEAAVGSYYTAAPGYLIQSDVLSVLGNVLTTRDDTFTIRAYGEIASKDGKQILSRSWCEATVQRTIDYVDPSNTPETPVTELNTTSGDLTGSGLSEINTVFGRKFEITSFRWLSTEEI